MPAGVRIAGGPCSDPDDIGEPHRNARGDGSLSNAQHVPVSHAVGLLPAPEFTDTASATKEEAEERPGVPPERNAGTASSAGASEAIVMLARAWKGA